MGNLGSLGAHAATSTTLLSVAKTTTTGTTTTTVVTRCSTVALMPTSMNHTCRLGWLAVGDHCSIVCPLGYFADGYFTCSDGVLVGSSHCLESTTILSPVREEEEAEEGTPAMVGGALGASLFIGICVCCSLGGCFVYRRWSRS